jgi:hypothetical protein
MITTRAFSILALMGCLVSCNVAATPDQGCTIVTASVGDEVFFAGNDDFTNTDSTYWVDPGAPGRYGAIYFGASDNVQQAFNEKGLAYDANGLPRVDVRDHAGTIPVPGGYGAYITAILGECATVEEVIAWAGSHRWRAYMHDQMHFADPTGDAVVISVGPDGRLSYTRKEPGDSFLITTNFNIADARNGGYPCWRYDLGTRMLRDIVDSGSLTRDDLAEVMEAVHVESASGWTLYTLVADLRRGLVSVYFMFQYDAPIVLDIETELAGGAVSRTLSSLFPPETVERGRAAHQRIFERGNSLWSAGLVWAGLVAASVLTGVVLAALGRFRPVAIPAAIILGPVGLIPELLWRTRAWVLYVGLNVSLVVVTTLATLFVGFAFPQFGNSSLATILALCAAPALLALLFVNAPLAVREHSVPYHAALGRAAVSSVTATFLALALVAPIIVPASLWSVNQMDLSLRALVVAWGVSGLGAIPAVAALALYHRVRVRPKTSPARPRLRSIGWLAGSAILLVAGLVVASGLIEVVGR